MTGGEDIAPSTLSYRPPLNFFTGLPLSSVLWFIQTERVCAKAFSSSMADSFINSLSRASFLFCT